MATVKLIDILMRTPKVTHDNDLLYSLTKSINNLSHTPPHNPVISNICHNLLDMDEANQS